MMARRRLEHLAASVDYGVTASASMVAVGPRFLRITDIQDDAVDWASVPYCAVSPDEERLTRLEVGDIVFARTGATTGKSHLLRSCPDRTVFASYLIRVRPDREQTDPRYLAWFFQTPDYWRQVTSKASGTAQPGVNATKLKSLTVPTPALPEQRRIAALLDEADALRRKRRESRKLLDELLRSTFTALVGAGHREQQSWPRRRIEQLAAPGPGSMRTGPFGSALRHSEFVDEGIAVLGIDNAVNNRFAWDERRFITPAKYEGLRRYTVRPGDVLITIMGTTGRSAVVPDDILLAITTKHLATITVDRSLVHPEFLANAIHLEPAILHQVAGRSRGAIMDGLNLGLIRELELNVPPLDQQAKFAAAVASIRASEAQQEAAGAEADRLFSSLMQAAFADAPKTAEPARG